MSARGGDPQKRERNRAEAFRIWLIAGVGLVFVRLLALTWRFKLCNDTPWRRMLARGQATVFAVWHGDMLGPAWVHRRHGLVALISDHRDGEIIARVFAGLGLDSARGSTTRGGSRALLTMIRALEAGRSCAFTPDGPRGPRHVLQPGILAAARRARVPIVLIGMAVSRSWHFKSWDRFTLPKPFARICLVSTDPTMVETGIGDIVNQVPRFTTLIEDAEAVAQRELARG